MTTKEQLMTYEIIRIIETEKQYLHHSNDCGAAPYLGGNETCDDFCQVKNIIDFANKIVVILKDKYEIT